MKFDLVGLKLLGAKPLLEAEVTTWSDGTVYHIDPACLWPAQYIPLKEVSCSLEEAVNTETLCNCVSFLSGKPSRELTVLVEFNAIQMALNRTVSLEKVMALSDPYAAASTLEILEGSLQILGALVPSDTLSKKAVTETTANVLKVCAHLKKVCATSREHILESLTADSIYASWLSDPDRTEKFYLDDTPSKDILARWQQLVRLGVSASGRVAAISVEYPEESLRANHWVLKFEEEVREYLAQPDLLAVVQTPPQDMDKFVRRSRVLSRLLEEACCKAKDGSLHLMSLPPQVLEYLPSLSGEVIVHSSALAPTNPVALENAVAMWSIGNGPLSVADTLVDAASIV